jgi:hypothetical protein
MEGCSRSSVVSLKLATELPLSSSTKFGRFSAELEPRDLRLSFNGLRNHHTGNRIQIKALCGNIGN